MPSFLFHDADSRTTPSPARKRPPRPVWLFHEAPQHRPDAGDAAAVQELIDDILALVDLGLVWPVSDGGELRFAIADERDDDHEPPGDLAA